MQRSKIPLALSIAALLSIDSNSCARAKLVEVSLDDLMSRSTLVVRGKVDRDSKGGCCLIRVERAYKGALRAEVNVCSYEHSIEYPRLGRDLGKDVIVFLSSTGRCYDIVHGYRGLIRIEGSMSYVAAISGLPESMSLSDLESKLTSESKAGE